VQQQPTKTAQQEAQVVVVPVDVVQAVTSLVIEKAVTV
jgi:hypothetical protein